MTDLSPAADAVLDAYMNNCGWLDGPLEKDYRCAAAVLRAAADQVEIPAPSNDWVEGFVEGVLAFQRGLLAIAAELQD
jgi:hypothetical protein